MNSFGSYHLLFPNIGRHSSPCLGDPCGIRSAIPHLFVYTCLRKKTWYNFETISPTTDEALPDGIGPVMVRLANGWPPPKQCYYSYCVSALNQNPGMKCC